MLEWIDVPDHRWKMSELESGGFLVGIEGPDNSQAIIMLLGDVADHLDRPVQLEIKDDESFLHWKSGKVQCVGCFSHKFNRAAKNTGRANVRWRDRDQAPIHEGTIEIR